MLSTFIAFSSFFFLVTIKPNLNVCHLLPNSCLTPFWYINYHDLLKQVFFFFLKNSFDPNQVKSTVAIIQNLTVKKGVVTGILSCPMGSKLHDFFSFYPCTHMEDATVFHYEVELV